MDKPVIKGNTIIVPSNQDFLMDVDSFLEAKLRGCDIDESVIADIAISVSELVNNAMLHGNKSSPNKVVTIDIACENSTVSISVSDQGEGFDPRRIPNPLNEENLLREVGRGMFIVDSLMDNVDVEIGDSGTVITITKKIN